MSAKATRPYRSLLFAIKIPRGAVRALRCVDAMACNGESGSSLIFAQQPLFVIPTGRLCENARWSQGLELQNRVALAQANLFAVWLLDLARGCCELYPWRRGIDQASAAIKAGTPRMLISRLALYANILNALSALTLLRPRNSQ